MDKAILLYKKLTSTFVCGISVQFIVNFQFNVVKSQVLQYPTCQFCNHVTNVTI